MDTRHPPHKIGYIHHRAVMGGAETSLYELVTHLDGARYTPIVVLGEDGELAEKFAGSGIRVTVMDMPRPVRLGMSPMKWVTRGIGMLKLASKIAGICTSDGVSLMHANTVYTMLPLLAVPTFSRRYVPRMWTARDFIRKMPLAAPVAGASAAIIAISDAVRAHLIEEGMPDGTIRRVYNGVDGNRFTPPDDVARARAKKQLGIVSDIPLIIAVGQRVLWKRHELFLRAMLALKNVMPDAGFSCALIGGHLDSGGRRRDAEHVDAMIRELGGRLTTHGVPFHAPGQVDHIESWYRAADVLVSASDAEPFGRSLIEAFSSRVAVVSTNTGAKPEIVTHERNGLIAESSPDAISAAVLRLIRDPELKRTLADHALNDARVTFSARRMADDTMAVYDEALGLRAQDAT